MKYRLLASDFDDTLLRSDGTISEHTKEVIRDFEARGGVFYGTHDAFHSQGDETGRL